MWRDASVSSCNALGRARQQLLGFEPAQPRIERAFIDVQPQVSGRFAYRAKTQIAAPLLSGAAASPLALRKLP